MPTLGILSDTHGRLPQEALDALEGVDHIIHAGDIGDRGILLELEAIAPTTAVLGNNDYREDYGLGVNPEARLSIDGVKIFVVHRPVDADEAISSGKYDLVVHGHTHVPRDEMVGGTRVINPGCVKRPRCGSSKGVAILQIENGAIGPLRRVLV